MAGRSLQGPRIQDSAAAPCPARRGVRGPDGRATVAHLSRRVRDAPRAALRRLRAEPVRRQPCDPDPASDGAGAEPVADLSAGRPAAPSVTPLPFGGPARPWRVMSVHLSERPAMACPTCPKARPWPMRSSRTAVAWRTVGRTPDQPSGGDVLGAPSFCAVGLDPSALPCSPSGRPGVALGGDRSRQPGRGRDQAPRGGTHRGGRPRGHGRLLLEVRPLTAAQAFAAGRARELAGLARFEGRGQGRREAAARRGAVAAARWWQPCSSDDGVTPARCRVQEGPSDLSGGATAPMTSVVLARSSCSRPVPPSAPALARRPGAHCGRRQGVMCRPRRPPTPPR